MPRATNSPATRQRRKNRLKLAKGFRGARSKLFRQATEAVDRAQSMAYVHRKVKKRDFRKLWIVRINAACRLNDITYSAFINALNVKGIELNRKVLADLALQDPQSFTDLVNSVKN